MKAFIALIAFTAIGFAIPPKRVTNREYPDGSGSSKVTDPEKRQAIETFYSSAGKVTHKVLYQLDERLQPVSAIYYDTKNKIYQKCAFKLDGEDRIIQEVIYDAKGNLLGTKNYNYGTRNGKAIVIDIDTYDAQGNLIQSPKQSGGTKRRR
jgi:antitoxin component YwqK of YwqJK toxin-antitoxin module